MKLKLGMNFQDANAWSMHRCDIMLQERKSFLIKLSLMVFNIASFFLAVYFFFRHNKYCESGGEIY